VLVTYQVRSIAVVTTAVARGDLTRKIEIQVEGEMSTLKGSFGIRSLDVTDQSCFFFFFRDGQLDGGPAVEKITVPVQGVVMVQLKDVINMMVDKLGQFTKEVTRVSQEVGTEG